MYNYSCIQKTSDVAYRVKKSIYKLWRGCLWVKIIDMYTGKIKWQWIIWDKESYCYIISLQYMYKNMSLDINVTTKFEHNRGNESALKRNINKY